MSSTEDLVDERGTRLPPRWRLVASILVALLVLAALAALVAVVT